MSRNKSTFNLEQTIALINTYKSEVIWKINDIERRLDPEIVFDICCRVMELNKEDIKVKLSQKRKLRNLQDVALGFAYLYSNRSSIEIADWFQCQSRSVYNAARNVVYSVVNRFPRNFDYAKKIIAECEGKSGSRIRYNLSELHQKKTQTLKQEIRQDDGLIEELVQKSLENARRSLEEARKIQKRIEQYERQAQNKEEENIRSLSNLIDSFNSSSTRVSQCTKCHYKNTCAFASGSFLFCPKNQAPKGRKVIVNITAQNELYSMHEN